MDIQNDEIEIDLLELFHVLLRKVWIIVPIGMLTGVIGFVIAVFFLTPVYESTTGIYVMSRQDSDTVSLSDTQLSTQLTKDYEEIIRSRTVLEKVISDLGLADVSYQGLRDRLAITNARDTRIIYITVTDSDPALAKLLSDRIRDVAAERIKEVINVGEINIVDEANLPTDPSGPSVKKWALMGALIGWFLSAGIIVLKFILDDTIKTSDDVEKYLGWSTLALIPVIEEGASSKNKKKSAASSGGGRSSGSSKRKR